MTAADHTEGNGGIIRAPRRGPGRLALDLWRAGGSFRGFVEFALIGAVVLAFVPGQGNTGAAAFLRALIQGQSGAPTPAGKLAKPSTATELPKPSDRNALFVPRIGDLNIQAAYFDGIEEPLHGHLVGALAAYHARNAAAVNEILKDDPDNRQVLLLRGLASLSLPGPDAAAAGVAMLERAAGMGEARAAGILGVLKTTGLAGYARDPAAGREMLERAIAAGDAPAARVLGEGYVSGWSGALDPAKAERYLRVASDRGDVKATFRLAEMLYTGHGVAKNQGEAERLFLAAANAGNAEAQAMLGTIRLMPYSAGLTDNPDEALSWFERAAAQGEPHAMFYLGLFYMEYGERIGRLDPPRAFALFRDCAEKTLDDQCLFAYATAFDVGVGTARDPVMAYALYSMAAIRGPGVKAAAKRDEIGKTLSVADRTRANLLSTEFLKKKKPAATPLVDQRFSDVSRHVNNDKDKPLERKFKNNPPSAAEVQR